MPGYTRPASAKDAARLDIPPAELETRQHHSLRDRARKTRTERPPQNLRLPLRYPRLGATVARSPREDHRPGQRTGLAPGGHQMPAGPRLAWEGIQS
jgi:hypothetical protein